MASLLHLSLLLLLISLSPPPSLSSTSPLTPKSNHFPYWSRKNTTTTSNSHQQSQPPPFFTSKLSPLSPIEVATFSSLAPSNLSSNLPSFCAAARLLCSPSNYAANLAANPDPNRFLWNLAANPDPNRFLWKLATNPDRSTKNHAANLATNPDMKVSLSSLVEPGMFFRERELTKGTVMPMPDIRDNSPARSFLPRAIAGKIPFSAGKAMSIFNIPADSAMGMEMSKTISGCRREPNRGETKRCTTSAEDMVDFAVSVLGTNVAVRSTENTKGSKGDILIGDVKGVNGGKVTESVSCHEFVFPYLVYYCHSVPKVRVYEADILDVSTKQKINHGVAVCHLDTSNWSAGHAAFVALGSTPGQIEVCHWIFEGDMTWAIAN